MADADALFARAVAHLTGQGAPRDLAQARAFFGQAGAAGRKDAAVIHCNFVTSGLGGEPDWRQGLALLRQLAPVSPRSRRELQVIEAMSVTPAGDPATPPSGEVISLSPHITHFPALFTPAECRYLIEAATPMLTPSVVVDPLTGRQRHDPVRTSDGTGFTWPLENPAVHALNRRLAAASGTAPEQGEPLQILRYRPGNQYRTHYDYIPGFANQRVATMLVWLNEDYEGGETHFPSADLSLRYPAGDAILFRNVTEAGLKDPASAHAGLPVKSGEKLIASRWIRARRFEG